MDGKSLPLYKDRSAILVVGMHRSGTSALSGSLSKLGVDFGNNLLAEISGVNDKGFFEHNDVIKLHEELLHAIGRTWMDLHAMPDEWWLSNDFISFKNEIVSIIKRDFPDPKLIGVKDPRLCRLLPLWLDAFKDLELQAKIILCIRHPFEVANSLMVRDHFDFHTSLILWFWHVLEAEEFSRNIERSVLTYDELLADWQGASSRVAKELNILWPMTLHECSDNVDSFLDKKLNHASSHSAPDSSRLAKSALELYFSLQKEKSINAELFASIKKEFLIEIKRISPYIDVLNRCQVSQSEAAELERALFAEKNNSKQQVEYRDKLVSELDSQLADVQNNTKEQIEYRDTLVSELNVQLDNERSNAKEQIEYRDTLVSELNVQLDNEKSNAKEQIEYRDALLSERENQLSEQENQLYLEQQKMNTLLSSRKELLKRFIKLSQPAES